MSVKMLYDVNDIVQIHDIRWYRSRANIITGEVEFPGDSVKFLKTMVYALEKIAIIVGVNEESRSYTLKFDTDDSYLENFTWKSWMFKKIDEGPILRTEDYIKYDLYKRKLYRLDWAKAELDELLHTSEINDEILERVLYLTEEETELSQELERLSKFISNWVKLHK